MSKNLPPQDIDTLNIVRRRLRSVFNNVVGRDIDIH